MERGEQIAAAASQRQGQEDQQDRRAQGAGGRVDAREGCERQAEGQELGERHEHKISQMMTTKTRTKQYSNPW